MTLGWPWADRGLIVKTDSWAERGLTVGRPLADHGLTVKTDSWAERGLTVSCLDGHDARANLILEPIVPLYW